MKLRSLLAVRVPLEIKLKTSSILRRRFSGVYSMPSLSYCVTLGCVTWAERGTCIMPLLPVLPDNDTYESPPILGHSFIARERLAILLEYSREISRSGVRVPGTRSRELHCVCVCVCVCVCICIYIYIYIYIYIV